MKTSGSATRTWAFFVLTFAWSWTCWLLSPAVKPQSPLLATIVFAWLFNRTAGSVVAALLQTGP